MNVKDFLEITFVITAGIAMPFIVIGSYFNLVSSDERQKPIAIFFLIVSIIYALAYSYFSWKSLQKSESWKRIVKGEEIEKRDNKKN